MRQWDVIVVGSGAAGLTAARNAREAGAEEVLVLSKGFAGRAGATITSGGGVSIAGAEVIDLGFPGTPDDKVEHFIHDTIRSGSFLSEQHLVAAMAENVAVEVKALIEQGTRITSTPRAPGHSSGRGVNISGVEMQKAVLKSATGANVAFREDFYAAGLLKREGVVVGVGGLDRRTGETEPIFGKAVVLATGGTTSNWRLRTAPEELNGDGHAMALAAGAELIEMEMLQFLPCCLVAPDMWRGLQFPWILGPQSGIRAWLLNKYGERFLARWDADKMELATRDVVAAAMATEILEGRGSPNGGVYISWAHLPRDIIENFPAMSRNVSADWVWEGFQMRLIVDRILAGHAIEVAPAAHFSIGGVRIDPGCATAVPGLYAAGEVTGGVHGANRLSGNAGAQMLAQGRLAGRAAAAFAARQPTPDASDDWAELEAAINAPRLRNDGPKPAEVKSELETIVERALSPVRKGGDLDAGLDKLRGVIADALPRLACRTDEVAFSRDWSDALECRSAATIIEATLLSARAREHSIGAHRRTDAVAVPSRELRHNVVSRRSGKTTLTREAVVFSLLEPVGA